MESQQSIKQFEANHKVHYYTSNFLNILLQQLPYSSSPVTSINSLQYFRVDCMNIDEITLDFLKKFKIDNSTSFQFIFNEDKKNDKTNANETNLTLIFENNSICGILDNVSQQILNIFSFKLDFNIFDLLKYQNSINETFLQNPKFNIHIEMPINQIVNIETIKELNISCIYSTENDDTFKDFTISLSNEKNIVIHFCMEFVCFCSLNKLLLLPLFKSQTRSGWTKFKNTQIDFVAHNIKKCKIFIASPDDLIQSLQFFPVDLIQSFATQTEIINLQKNITLYTQELFTRNFTFDDCQSVTYSTYFYITENAITGSYLLTHPEFESTNPIFILSKNILKHYIKSTNYVDSTALFNLASMYSKGQGSNKNIEKAIKYYSKSASCGNPNALFNLGLIYWKGEDVSFDHQKALKLFQKASEKCHPKAQYNLGQIYNDSDLIERDIKKSISLFEKSASQNDSEALFKLGLMYFEGDYFNTNKSKAIELYQKSCKYGNPKAYFNLGLIYQTGEKGIIEKDNKTAIKYFLYAASHGIIQAQFNLGCLYSNGDKDFPVDKPKAAKLFTLASINDDSDAQLNLGAMYSRGEGDLKVNMSMAIDLYKKSARKNNPRALFNLGCIYSKGECVVKDTQKAVFYYKRASDLNMPKAIFNLGVLYFNGADGIQQNKKLAASLFEKVADKNPRALFNLALMYQRGDGVTKDEKKAANMFYILGEMTSEGKGIVNDSSEKALEYFKRAADLGNEKAQIKLGLNRNVGVENQNQVQNQNQKYEALSKKMKSLIKQAKNGDPNAQYLVGACYAVGEGVELDKEISLKYYLMAAKQGDKMAQYAAATCYSYGKGTEIDKVKAFDLYLKAANQGLDKAQFAVGHFLEYGQGGNKKDHVKALEWYKKAASQGYKHAIKALGSYSG